MIGLNKETIESLSSRPNVKRIAVENFLLTIGNCDTLQNALLNLAKDASLYRWNAETIDAIREGIFKYFMGGQ